MAGKKKAAEPAEPLTAPPPKSRGYYTTPLGRFKSVTTILEGGYPKHALTPWSARMTAEVAVDQIPWLASLRGRVAREDAADWLRHEHDRVKERSAAIGSAVHRYLEARALGAPTETSTATLAPFFAAVEDFLDVMTPEWEASELVVANPDDGYAGTADGWLRFPRHQVTVPGVTIIDAKSGRSAWGETGMQLGAYRRCPVGWLRDGTEVVPPIAVHGHVLHVRPPGIGDPSHPDPDHPGAGPGGWALIPADTSDAVHEVFLHVKAISDASYRISKKVLGQPLDRSPDLIDITPSHDEDATAQSGTVLEGATP